MLDLLIFVAVIGVLILGHELGHFLAARLTGVRVDEFGIGFPPRLLTLFRAGGTSFTLNLIPLGGFNRIAGEDDPSVPDGLAAAKKRVRAFVLLAGPAVNVLLAILAFTVAFKFAAPDTERVLITYVTPETPASDAGVLAGDLVTSVESQPITSFDTMQQAISSHLGEAITLVVERDGQPLTFEIIPRTETPSEQGPIGVVLGYPTREVGWLEAFHLGWDSTWMQFNEVFHLPGRLLRGEIRPEEARVSGLKGIYDMLSWAGSVDRSTQRPFFTLNMIGLIAVGLAIANLLPFPALDGGRLIFIAIEAIIGRRISPRYEGLAHAIGFVILLMLMIYINLQDFVNPIVIPR
jgi:regulator of sigma E protease